MSWLSETDLLRVRDDARAGRLPDADTIEKLVDQARHLDFVSTSIAFQRLQDVNALVKRMRKALREDNQEELALLASVKGPLDRCVTHLDELHGACVRYRDGWPSAHVVY